MSCRSKTTDIVASISRQFPFCIRDQRRLSIISHVAFRRQPATLSAGESVRTAMCGEGQCLISTWRAGHACHHVRQVTGLPTRHPPHNTPLTQPTSHTTHNTDYSPVFQHGLPARQRLLKFTSDWQRCNKNGPPYPKWCLPGCLTLPYFKSG